MDVTATIAGWSDAGDSQFLLRGRLDLLEEVVEAWHPNLASCGRARAGAFNWTPLLVLRPVAEHAAQGPEARRRFGPGRATAQEQAEGGQGRAGKQEPPVRQTDG